MKTQQDVASAAGVSVMTVSRVLGHRPGVSAATREKVLRAMKEIGFKVPASLGSWRIQRRSGRRRAPANVVLLTGKTADDSLMQGAWSEMLAAVEARVAKSDAAFDTMVINPKVGLTPDRVDQILRNRGVAGVLLGPGLSAADLQHLSLKQYALVALDLSAQNLPVDRVTPDRIALMDRIFRIVTDLGARRPALMTGARPQFRDDLWSSAFSEAQRFLVAPASQIPPFAAPLDPGLVEEWARVNRPDFIFSSSVSVFEAARTGRGLPPAKLFGLDLPPAFLGGRFSGAYSPVNQLATTAVDVLLSKAWRGAFGQGAYPKVMLLPCSLHIAPDAPQELATTEIPLSDTEMELDPIEFDLLEDVLGK